jgi:hypothetical protein
MPSQQQKPIMPQESISEKKFPFAGIDVSGPFSKQMPKPAPGGTVSETVLLSGALKESLPQPSPPYFATTPVGTNVRAFDAVLNRMRGGSRPGLVPYLPGPVGGIAGWIVQGLNQIVGNQVPGGGTVAQTSSSGRVVTLAAVSQGNIYTANSGDTTWTTPTNNTGRSSALNFTGIVNSAPNNQKLWFVDGSHYVVYTPAKNSVDNWVAATVDQSGNPITGSLPVDSAGNTARLCANWRGRMVLAGLLLDPQDWFMSAIQDPTNWDYFPLSTTPSQAVAGNNSPLGTVGDVLTTLIPYTDDILVFGGDSTIWMLNGDPMAGGQIDLVSDRIGMAWNQSWTKDPYGNIYFVSNKCGIYTLVPGQIPQRISQSIESLLLDIDTGANTFSLIWNDRYQGLHVFVTPTQAPAPTTHFFYELRTGAWWQDSFENQNHNPLCTCTFDGNTAGDRVSLIGSWDGFVRAISPTATTDDGFPIDSEVIIGPILTQDQQTILVKELISVLGEESESVMFAVYTGTTAEAALSATPVISGTWNAGRNFANFIRQAAHAIWVRITSSNPWQMEGIRFVISGKGKVRARQRRE